MTTFLVGNDTEGYVPQYVGYLFMFGTWICITYTHGNDLLSYFGYMRIAIHLDCGVSRLAVEFEYGKVINEIVVTDFFKVGMSYSFYNFKLLIIYSLDIVRK